MELRNLSSAGDCISEITQQLGMVVGTRNFERTENWYCKEPHGNIKYISNWTENACIDQDRILKLGQI